MPAIAAMTLNNNAAVGKAFNPAGISKEGVVRWNTVAEAVFDARNVVTQGLVARRANSEVDRVKQRIVIPHMDAVDTTKKVGESYVNIEWVLSKRSSLTNRLDLRAFAVAVINGGYTTAALSDLENPY